MTDIAGSGSRQAIMQLLTGLCVSLFLAGTGDAQVYAPIFKSVEMQATIAPLGEMVEGNFYGRRSIAAISKSEKAIYIFEPDTLENLILANVISLPDSPIAIYKAREILIGGSGQKEQTDKLVVLLKPHNVALVSFDADGLPEISERPSVDAYSTDVRAADMETSGKLDIVAFGKFSLGITVERGLGKGRFQQIQPMPGPLGNVPFSDIAFADFNGDLVPDLAALDWVNRKLLIFYGRGDGTFAQPVSFPLKAEPSALSVADLGGSGYPDIVVGYTRLPEIDIFRGDGFGRFFLRQTIKTSAPVSKFAIADYTGDGAMDIAALSRTAKEIMMYSYDPLSRQFRYSGVVGTGDQYDDIIPFSFSHRIRSDLVASSPTEKFIKVFKSIPAPGIRPDLMIPVCPDPAFLSILGSDTSNFLVAGNLSGSITARFSTGMRPVDTQLCEDWQGEGEPSSVKLISRTRPAVLVSYSNADMFSLYNFRTEDSSVTEASAQTAFLPFTVGGEMFDDSASVAVAYRIDPDSTVGISLFTSVRGKTEFIERDFSVRDRHPFISSALCLTPALSFLRLWKQADDTISLAITALSSNGTSIMQLRGSGARLVEIHDGSSPLLSLMENDTLNLFSIKPGAISGMTMDSVCSMPLDSSYFGSLRIATYDSTCYLAYVNHRDKSVFMFTARNQRLRFIKAWRVNDVPADICISPSTRSVYFLNSNEAYVSIHNF